VSANRFVTRSRWMSGPSVLVGSSKSSSPGSLSWLIWPTYGAGTGRAMHRTPKDPEFCLDVLYSIGRF
jgi:hypothetical protein